MQPQLTQSEATVSTHKNKTKTPDQVDILIVGSGIAGICSAYYLQKYCPNKTFTILEARKQTGGTWDQFRYPGVRSDSDAFTLAYSFKPWTRPEAITSGSSILEYFHETIDELGLEKKIHCSHKVISASWSTQEALWTATVEKPDSTITQIKCRHIYLCTGYFDQEKGYQPDWNDEEKFQGQIVHPQNWPENLDYKGKKVIVIGSGATAISMIPEMAKETSQLTMLQRSPTYIFSRSSRYWLTNILRSILPARIGFAIARGKAAIGNVLLYQICRRAPLFARYAIKMHNRRKLGYSFDTSTHFTPTYAPWDQRFCLDADSTFFQSVREGHTSVVTDNINKFTTKGILLQSGKELEADIIVSATGLNMKAMGGIQFKVDGTDISTGDLVNYKGIMYSDLPNLVNAQGYINASWTLRCEFGASYFTRILNHMDKEGYKVCIPRNHDNDIDNKPAFFLRSSYIMRSRDNWPKQGKSKPWKVSDNQILDQWSLNHSNIEDGILEFSSPKHNN